MRVLAVNGGSSSLRWGLFETDGDVEVAAGAIERVRDLQAAWAEASGTLANLAPDAVGHRVVHGGERFTEAVRIDHDVTEGIEAQVRLAPVHNRRCLLGIREAQKLFPEVPHVAVFDTAFHQSMPPAAYRYALPQRLYEKDRIRRYGFHGSSHRHASERAAAMLPGSTDAFTGVTVHLGNGCSIAAIEDGRSVDTSMGMTPLEGLMMGTRSGDVDPAVVLDLAARPEFGPERAKTLLNEESGLLGVSGLSSDLREIEAAAAAGDPQAALARDIFAHRVRRGIGAALGVLGRADAVVLTGGIGENAADMRERVLLGMSGLGLELDRVANRDCVGREGSISTPDSRIAIFVVRAQEERLIARETAKLLAGAA
ncbi:MAG: acetate/propionate family kinase [Myxococcota bacterium]|nr:acetate/propionate family kinase [Myxococcota bacterium]